MLSPNGRVILISGANRGIGLATAKYLDSLGYVLSLGARQPDDLPKLRGSSEQINHYWDAEKPDTSEAWVKATIANYGRIDGLVLNAGVELGGSLENGTEEEFDRMFAINFKGPLWLARAALPHLRASGAGRVINIASLAGKRVLKNEILGYSASKFAAVSLTQAIRQAGWGDGVRATAVKNITFRNVAVIWEAAASLDNGAYGLYPVEPAIFFTACLECRCRGYSSVA